MVTLKWLYVFVYIIYSSIRSNLLSFSVFHHFPLSFLNPCENQKIVCFVKAISISCVYKTPTNKHSGNDCVLNVDVNYFVRALTKSCQCFIVHTEYFQYKIAAKFTSLISVNLLAVLFFQQKISTFHGTRSIRVLCEFSERDCEIEFYSITYFLATPQNGCLC